MPSPSRYAIQRHYGLDWLRIGAFGLLILFHIGLYFSPGHWIVKSPEPVEWLAWPLAAIVPWRLSLLFAISGYASAALLQRHPGLLSFLAQRTKRLLIPLLFGVCVIVPPQDWVRLEVGGIDQPYLSYLLTENFSFRVRLGTFLPSWEHLWFLADLWVYTVLLIAPMAAFAHWKPHAERLLSWLAAGRRAIYLPLLPMLGGTLLFTWHEDPVLARFCDYFPAFLFGCCYAWSGDVRRASARLVPEAALLSAASLAAAWLSVAWADWRFELVADTVMSWTMLPVLFHLADRFLNFDHRWRAPLAGAVFPAYLVHQTVIVVLGWHLGRFGVTGWSAFAALLGAVVLACWLAWKLAKSSPAAGLVLGVAHRAARQPRMETQEAPAV